MEPTRRDLIVGIAAVVAAAVVRAVPAVPPLRRGSHEWLLKILGEPPFAGNAEELADLDWGVANWPTMSTTLNHLKRGPIDPDARHEPNTARALRCLILKGEAKATEDGRIRITALGEAEYEAERLESYG
jgi:hypothetical protein